MTGALVTGSEGKASIKARTQVDAHRWTLTGGHTQVDAHRWTLTEKRRLRGSKSPRLWHIQMEMAHVHLRTERKKGQSGITELQGGYIRTEKQIVLKQAVQ